MKRIPLLFIASLFILTSCSQEEKTFTVDDTAHFQSTIQGKVIDKSGVLAGVLVLVTPGAYSTTTDENGEFEFSTLQTGRYRFQFLKEDYRDTLLKDSVEIGLLDDQELDPVKLRYRFASVNGTVVDSIDATHSDIGIAIENQANSALSISGGEFSINQLEPGKLRIYGAKQDMGYGYTDVTVKADSTLADVQVTLNKRGGVIKGTIINIKGVLLQHIDVQAFQGAIKAKTDSVGKFEITDMPKEGDSRIQMGNSQVQTFCTGVNLEGEDTLDAGVFILEATPDSSIKIPNSFHLATTLDSSMLIMPWTSKVASIKPLWYYWSFDNGATWTTTTEPRLKLKPSVRNWSPGNYFVKVRCMSKDSVSSNTSKITVSVRTL